MEGRPRRFLELAANTTVEHVPASTADPNLLARWILRRYVAGAGDRQLLRLPGLASVRGHHQFARQSCHDAILWIGKSNGEERSYGEITGVTAVRDLPGLPAVSRTQHR